MAALLIGAMPAMAQRARLDDSLSPIDTFNVEVGLPPGGIAAAARALRTGSAAGLMLTGRIPAVEVRLDAVDYVGGSARIFLTLPLTSGGVASPADLELRWEATGNFLPGSVRPGQSVLVFDGVIEQPVISVMFSFSVLFENSLSSEVFDLEPYYEIEPQP